MRRRRRLERQDSFPFAVDVIFEMIRLYAIKAIENTFCILGRVHYWMWLYLMCTMLNLFCCFFFLAGWYCHTEFLHILSSVSVVICSVMCCLCVESYTIIFRCVCGSLSTIFNACFSCLQSSWSDYIDSGCWSIVLRVGLRSPGIMIIYCIKWYFIM